jgi:hypothetical protein
MKKNLGDFETSYKNYLAGGAIRKKLLMYSPEQDQILFEKIEKNANRLNDSDFNPITEEKANKPIFILGMPRSGTTLVEQIISCHSKIEGAGELPFVGRFGGLIADGTRSMSADNFSGFYRSYTSELEKISNGKPFVTDKMPQNFLYIGLILKTFPGAKIIHVKRDPAATCWSNFSHYFEQKGLGYSYSLDDTVRYFGFYKKLIDFWEQLHTGCIYHLDYERLIVEQEIETKRLIEYLELDWEEPCLLPEENERIVKTASQQQVREKIYAGSSQAWRKFEPYLNGALDDLGTQ